MNKYMLLSVLFLASNLYAMAPQSITFSWLENFNNQTNRNFTLFEADPSTGRDQVPPIAKLKAGESKMLNFYLNPNAVGQIEPAYWRRVFFIRDHLDSQLLLSLMISANNYAIHADLYRYSPEQPEPILLMSEEVKRSEFSTHTRFDVVIQVTIKGDYLGRSSLSMFGVGH